MRKSEGKRLPRKPRRRWVDNIRMEVKKGNVGVEWHYVAEDKYKLRAFVNTIINL